MVTIAIIKVVCYGLVLGALLIIALLGLTMMGGTLARGWDIVVQRLVVALQKLIPRDWAKEKRKEGIVFCSEVWYYLPVAARWITLDR